MKGKHYHPSPAEINANGGNTGLYICAVWKTMIELSNLVLFEEAELGHDQLMIFNEELNKVLRGYADDKKEYNDRLQRMRDETGIHSELSGGHVIIVDDTTNDVTICR